MRIEPLGDSAFIMRDLAVPAHQLAAAINDRNVTGVTDAVACYDCVGLYVDPSVFSVQSLDDLANLSESNPRQVKTHSIPVDYSQGPDSEELCSRLGLTARELVEIHTSGTYECRAIGFCPGFPYLGGLDARLASMPRKPTPATRVEPGTVAMAGDQTGVYTLPRPGGWWRLGVTPLCLVDVDAGYFPIAVGDRVIFESIGTAVFDQLLGSRL